MMSSDTDTTKAQGSLPPAPESRTSPGRGGNGVSGGRSSGGRGRSYSGRTPVGGRSLVPTDGGRVQHTPQQRPPPVTVHQSSGVPFGHVPAYLPGSSSLVEELDQRILIVLRDGKHLIGVSFRVQTASISRPSTQRSNLEQHYIARLSLPLTSLATWYCLMQLKDV